MAAGTRVYHFGAFTVDARTGELSHARRRAPLRDQSVQLLLALLEQPGELVTRDELRRRLWAADTEKARKAQLKLVRFHVDANPLENVLNSQAKTVRDQMKDEGNDARICSSAWVVVSAELGQRFATATAIKVEATTTQGLKITAQGGKTWSGSESIVLGAGTVFAYGLHKVKKWDGERVEDLEDDWPSFN
ncbi:MAG TPA: hypothetical protein VFT24_05465 [Vicinamibacterales bacterium]|nr:hypothetical protein [Vicinamibacterales bacterium]